MANTKKKECPTEKDPRLTFVEQEVELPKEVLNYLEAMYSSIVILSYRQNIPALCNLMGGYYFAKRLEELLRPFNFGEPLDKSLEELQKAFTPERLEEIKKQMAEKVKELDPEGHLSQD